MKRKLETRAKGHTTLIKKFPELPPGDALSQLI